MTKKHYFVLKNIEPVEIDAKYSFYVHERQDDIEFVSATLTASSKTTHQQRTKITDLTQKSNEKNIFSFLDESKKEHNCILTMICNNSRIELPEKTTIHCYWCRHNFETRPLGCPIKYVPNRIIKNYYSEITKDNYTLMENISNKQLTENKDSYRSQNINMINRDYFITDGVFCSFNCCLAFIYDHNNNPLYTYSENLLKQIYIKMFGDNHQPIISAPSWRLLQNYGGSIPIDDFRKNFYKVEYKNIYNVIYPSFDFKPIGFLFEKQVRI